MDFQLKLNMKKVIKCFYLFTHSSSGLVNNLNSVSSQLPVVESQITEIKLNEDGKLLYAAIGDKVKIWDLRKLVFFINLS